MQIIYRAIDGKEFDNQLDCQHYELHLQQSIVMLNHNGEQVHETSRAYLVWLRDVEANLAFHAMARAENDNFVKSIIEGEDCGLFYWDEDYNEYRWIDPDMVEGLVKMKQIIEERGGSL